MWAVIELILLLAIILIFFTEFFLPLILGKPLFGSFRKTMITENENSEEFSLDDKVSLAKEKVREVKNVQYEINDRFKQAEQLKEESDKLLK